MSDLKSFQTFLYKHIPLVENMQLGLSSISDQTLTAMAPLAPNINDKGTVFGGSSSALMTICGWSLIKYHLEQNKILNDVVIYQSHVKWLKAQHDDLSIHTSLADKIIWPDFCESIKKHNRNTKVKVRGEVLNQAAQICSEMVGEFVIVKAQR